jgi:hypothetical protein
VAGGRVSRLNEYVERIPADRRAQQVRAEIEMAERINPREFLAPTMEWVGWMTLALRRRLG